MGGNCNRVRFSQVLVCAPSNIAVDQLTEKIHKTGLKVNTSPFYVFLLLAIEFKKQRQLLRILAAITFIGELKLCRLYSNKL